MLSSLALRTIARASATRCAAMAAPTVARASAARFMSARPFAVDAPDGEHDLENVEESGEWAKRTIEVASITEDADAITRMHEAVLGDKTFAVDAPDGEHDMEDVEEHQAGVKRIIDEASLFENPEDVKAQQEFRDECRKEAIKSTQHDM